MPFPFLARERKAGFIPLRILLINPPYPVCEGLTMPLGLLSLAGRLETFGHEVQIADLQLCRSPMKRLRAMMEKIDPTIVGITSFSINLHRASRILKGVKRIHPGAITVWGGPHVSFDDVGVIREQPWVDAVIRGEGEESLHELVSRVEGGKGLQGVLGVTFRDPQGDPVRNPMRPFQEDLSGLPRPSWHLLPLSQYRAFGDGASLLTSRGCPHRCVFCVGRRMIGSKGRFRTPQAVVDDMEGLVELGFSRIRIEDDLFTFRKERVLAICREIANRGLSIRWRAYSRVDTIDPEVLEWMGRTGCERIMFGAESGASEILRLIRKGISPEQTRQAVEMTRAAGIGVLASFVLGLPGETPETLKRTLDFAESLEVPYSLNLLTPYPGTEIRENASQWGIRILSDDWRLYGQGKALTATAQVGPWHLNRAIRTFQRRVARYMEDVLEREKKGTISNAMQTELDHHRRWVFLRELIGKEILETHGTFRGRTEPNDLGGLARSVSRAMGRTPEEVRGHLASLLEEGHIRATPVQGGLLRWAWT